jgi:hypothetical protein
MIETVFHIGDHVTLTRPLGPCGPGDEGVVANVDSHGNVAVDITHRNPGCVPFVFPLPPATPDHFSLGGICHQANIANGG